MKILLAMTIAVLAFVSPLAAQTAPAFTGKWEGTFIVQRPDGTDGPPQSIVLNLTQKGKVLTGTAGPATQQWDIAKGAINAGKATFEVQQPNGGPLLKFTMSIVKGRLLGDVVAERDGVVRKGKVDAGKAK